MSKLKNILSNNKRWAESIKQSDPSFFKKLSELQKPKYLWIGCSDSRVPANQITGMLPGEIFVHRNVGNIVGSTDLNCLSVIQYAIDVLGVTDVIVCGHYGCGAIQAAWENRKFGLIDYWLSPIKNVRDKHRSVLDSLETVEQKLDKLCELSVVEQAKTVCETAIIQDAWKQGKEVSVHGWIYRLADGRINDLNYCVSSPEEMHAMENL